MIVAVPGGAVLGNLIAFASALGIDASYAAKVTGEPWALTLPNILYAIFIGLLVGLIAGLIAGRKGCIVGPIALCSPLILGVAIILAHGVWPADVGSRMWHWSTGIGLVTAWVGGYGADRLLTDEQAISELRAMGWHWAWLWLPLLVFLGLLSGSIRFLIADFLLPWQILFRPSFWIIGLFFLPIIASLLYLTFSLPMSAAAWLPSLLGNRPQGSQLSRGNRTVYVLLIVVGVPLVTLLVWLIDGWILSVFEANGFRIY